MNEVERTHVAVGIVLVGVVSTLVALLTYRCFCRKPRSDQASDRITRTDSMNERLQSGIAKLHQDDNGATVKSRSSRSSYYMFRRGVAGSPLFSWSEHPSLVTDAVEHGWSRFAFVGLAPSPRLLGMCAVVGDFRRGLEPEMGWEICQDSPEFVQKIRLNPGLTIHNNTGSNAPALSVIRTGLPLPGPALGKLSSFPQEAYFEITVVYCGGEGEEERVSVGSKNSNGNGNGNRKVKEGEKTKLIQEKDSDSSIERGIVKAVEDFKIRDGAGSGVMFSVGLTAGGSLPLKLPGSYPGSIGFNSDGSVYVDGIKLAFATEKAEWEKTDKVIGCGFDPRQKKVFFTVDSEVIHVVHCKSDEFGAPLYPTLTANGDVLVLVNFGQSVFKYGPANSQRTSNPCFVGPGNSPAATIGYDDSKELFSMGRIDAQWLNRCTTARGGQNPGNPSRVLDYDEESEADLFEIVLDSCGRSPNVVS